MKYGEAQSQHGRSIFALIVAIDEYANREVIPQLGGCLNDAEDFRSFLETDLSVPSANIRMLTNESATRDAILSTFKSYLLHNPKIANGDLIFFFYAGHGDSLESPAGWYPESGRVETICPYDMSAFGRDNRTIDLDSLGEKTYGIPDRTFNALMRMLAANKGDNIVRLASAIRSDAFS